MTETTTQARAVIVGAGIVGNSLAFHLARLGWRDLVLIDKGPMPNPGGSTGHASNFIFPVDYSKMMTELTADSTAQYKELGVFIESGGIEVARTEARRQELRRRAAAATAWGYDHELLSPDEVAKKVPYLDPASILEGLYFPNVGVVDSLRAGTLMRERAQEMGALVVRAGVEVLGIDLTPEGAVRAVQTSVGEIETDVVAICCGVWSPRIAEMAGATIPLTPVVHQMISVGPVPLFADTVGEITYPIVRDMDTNMYERQHGGDIEVGSYAHRPIIVNPEQIPSIEESALSPTEMPFTQEDFDPQLAEALELMPELLGDERVGVRYAINGLISITPDGHPALGECPEVKGLWSVAASWIKEGPGIARAVAEWMNGDAPEIDLHEADIARFYGHQRTRAHVTARAAESFNKMYGIVHPAEQWESQRPTRVSPVYAREQQLGAFFYETTGWERPFWYQSNEGLLDTYAGRLMERTAEWESRWWSPIINAEHLALRQGCGLVDLSAFVELDVTGPGALAGLQNLAVAQMDVAVGRVVYTPFLNDRGGFKSDLTIMRLGHEHFRVVTGAGTGMAEKKWIVDHLPADGSAQLTDVTSAWTTFGLWGPRARDVLAAVTRDDVSHTGFPFGHCRTIELGGVSVIASRISYIGELGWEIYVPMEEGARVWETLYGAGQPFGLLPVGIGVYGTTGRLEKGYRALGNELTTDYTIVEAGMARPTVKKDNFIGRAAYLAQRDTAPVAHLCTLTVDDHRSASGELRYMLGGEPIVDADGERLVDAKGRPSYVTSAGSGPSVGKHILLAYLPVEHATEGAKFFVEYLGELYPVTVAVVGATPLFDPENERVPQLSVNVLVCVKRVPMVGSRINLTDDELAVDTRQLGFTVSPHEECAVEEAVRIVEAHGGTVWVLTLGPAEAVEQLRDAAAIGATRLIHLVTDGREWDPMATADALAEEIRIVEAAHGTFDLILFGNEAPDTGDYQVGIRVAHALGRPSVSGIKSLELTEGELRARRDFAGGDETFEVELPAVVSVKEGINLPRYPSLPGRIRAKKVPVEAGTVSWTQGASTVVRLRTPVVARARAEVLGTGVDAVPALVSLLERLGVVS